MNITEYIKNNILYLDGGMGTLLQENGLKAGELPERMNISSPETVVKIHKAYFDAGSNVINTNTFGANVIKFTENELDKIICAAIDNAKKAREESKGKQPKWIALDIGPTGRLLKPYGDLDFEDAVNIFKKTVKSGVKYGVDLIFIETMNDLYETKAAVIAAKETCDLPVFVSNAFDKNGRLMTGASARAVIATLEGLNVNAIGLNCSFGPETLIKTAEEYLKYSSLPVIFKPNAGLPEIKGGKTVYGLNAKDFSIEVVKAVKKGVRICGGCCGTTPEYIKELVSRTAGIKAKPIKENTETVISSYTDAVVFNSPVLVGERINPTGKKRFKQALIENDLDYILKEGVAQQEKGADVLDVNVGLPDIDEEKTLVSVIKGLQAVSDLPLQIDTSSFSAMEKALRIYNGKALINSVNGKEESMNAVFPLVKKYGGVVVALTLDEKGIPDSAEDRVKIAEKIIKRAKEYGIDKKNIVVDPLTLTVSVDKNAAATTLKAVKLIKEKLKVNTILGVSNVSFGLPERDLLNAEFLTLALSSGLSAAIVNPNSAEIMKAYYTYRALNGLDEGFNGYIDFALNVERITENGKNEVGKKEDYKTDLQKAIVKGLKEEAGKITGKLLTTIKPTDIIQNEIIPALDRVGVGFENKTVYLPGLLMSAEAAKSSFEVIKGAVKKKTADKCRVVLATVKGDIHDIGKNIVKLLLENYGFNVTDLGKDVAPEKIAETAVLLKAPVVGLSALMTTTVPYMEETVKLLRKKAPWCKVVVGGAVLNKEYALKMGADKYCKDAMETVRYLESVNEKLKKENA